jgi:predicted nucleotidyltransferase
VSREVLKLSIAYKAETNFVDIVPQAKRLRLSLNMPFAELDNPKDRAKNVAGMGRWRTLPMPSASSVSHWSGSWMTLPRLSDQNAHMTTGLPATTPFPIDPRVSAVASGIAAAIPEAQVRLFGSRARGTARPDSDVDLLITVPDPWLAGHDRVRVLGDLWRRFSSHQLPLDLLLYSESEVLEWKQFRSAVTIQAYQEGILLHG